MSVSDHFMPIPPRHRRCLEFLQGQRKFDLYGAIGTRALRDEDEPFSLEQIVGPLYERGLVEDLTETELGHSAGRYFTRITKLGEICLGLGYMLRDPRKTTEAEIKKYSEQEAAEQQRTAETLAAPPTSANPYDPNEEKEAIV